MKKIIIGVVVFVLIVVVLVAVCLFLSKQNQSLGTIEYLDKSEVTDNDVTQKEASIYREYNQIFDSDGEFEKIQSLTNLTAENEIAEASAKSLYYLDNIDNVSIRLRSSIVNNDFNDECCEIAIIRVPNTNESLNIINAVSKRIGDVKNLNTEDAELEAYVIEQTKGILTVVISKDARNISNLLTESLKVEE